jgi:quinolinate synthase
MSSEFSTASGSFPSLVIRSDRLEPRGAFAEAQARYLNPDAASVAELGRLLRHKQIGVAAHFYMDPELQGVLSACDWPHIHISDSLEMADRAVEMFESYSEPGASTRADAAVDPAGFAIAPGRRYVTRLG